MFKIRPLHDRISKPVVAQTNQLNPANQPAFLPEEENETVFILNEETGEFTQEVRKKNTNEETIVLDEGHDEEKQQPQQPQVPPPKRTSNFVGLSMKKNIKASFM